MFSWFGRPELSPHKTKNPNPEIVGDLIRITKRYHSSHSLITFFVFPRSVNGYTSRSEIRRKLPFKLMCNEYISQATYRIKEEGRTKWEMGAHPQSQSESEADERK